MEKPAVANQIHVYGTDWCSLTYRVREYLMRARLTYEYFDIDRDSGAEDFVMSMSEGLRRFPLVVIDHAIVIDPTKTELQDALEEHEIRPAPRDGDRAADS